MARDERFKKYQEAGVDFLESARARAEEFLSELAKASDTTQKQGRDALDDLVEGSRRGTEQVISSIRKEITSQLSLLGIATKDDLSALERRLTGKVAAAKASPAKKTTAKKTTAKKTAAKKTTAKSSAARSTTARKSPAKKSSAAKKA